MKTFWLAALVCAATLPLAAARGAGFEGLRPDGPNAIKGQSGEIAALDPGQRTFRIGGNTFQAPKDLALDFATLHVGEEIVVYYRASGKRNEITSVERSGKKK